MMQGLTQAAISPKSPYETAKFSFIPKTAYKTARKSSEANETAAAGNQPTVPTTNDYPEAITNMRSLIFEAPTRPLDVARNMYLDYTYPQPKKFYGQPGDPFNEKRAAE